MTEQSAAEHQSSPSAASARRRCATLAGHCGDVVKARAYLHDNDVTVRCSALRALARSGDLSVSELQSALGDSEAVVRLTAVELAADNSDIAVSVIAKLLNDHDSRVVEAAAWACGEKISNDQQPNTGHAVDSIVETLARLAQHHEDMLCRESAIAALGAISDPAGLPAILAGLEDKPDIRRRAVIALAPFDGPEVDAALQRAARDRDRQVRAAATELLNL